MRLKCTVWQLYNPLAAPLPVQAIAIKLIANSLRHIFGYHCPIIPRGVVVPQVAVENEKYLIASIYLYPVL